MTEPSEWAEKLEPCPTAWMYWPAADKDELPFVQLHRANMDPRYWAETPLYTHSRPMTEKLEPCPVCKGLNPDCQWGKEDSSLPEDNKALIERAVMVCPQCEGEGGYPDGVDEAACHTECTRCGGEGYIVDAARIAQLAEDDGTVRNAVLEEVARMVDRRRDERFAEHGTREWDTNACYYSGQAGEMYESLDEEDEEIASAIRAMESKP